MSFFNKILMTFGTKLLLFFFGIITSVLTARILGPEGKGIVAIAFLIPNLLASFGGLSIGSAHVYFLGKKKYKLIDVFSNSVILPILFSIVYITLFILFFSYLREKFFETINPLYVLIPFFALPIYLFNKYSEAILRGLYMIKEYNLVMILNKASYVLYLIILLLILKFAVLGAIIASLLAFFTVFSYMFLRIIKISKFHLSLNTKLFVDSLKFGIKEHIGNIAQKLNVRLDMFFITALWGPTYLGLYTISVALAELVWYIPDSIGIVLFPKISSLNKEDADRLIPVVCRNGLLMAFLCSIGLIVLGKIIIKIMYGIRFLPSLEPLLFLLPGVFFLTIPKILTKYTSGIGKPQYNTYSSLAALISTVVFLIILVPKYNIVGAAIATSIAYFVFAVTITYFYIKESKNSILETFIIRKKDIQIYKNMLARLFSR